MPSSSSSPWRPFLGLFVLLALAALLLLAVMRGLAPLRDPDSSPGVPRPPTTQQPSPSEEDPNDGKPADPGVPPTGPQDPPIAISPVRAVPEGSVCDDLHYICVDMPKTGGVVSSPTQFSGTAIAFENTVQWRVEDGAKNVLARGFATADAPDVGRVGTFSVRAFWDTLPVTATGTLVVYEDSAKDGKPIHVLTLPIRFAPTALMTRKVFLVPPTADQGTDCTQLVAVNRSMPSSLLPVEATLRALLREPLALGESTVPHSVIPEGTRLISVVVSGGTAKVVLSNELENYGGGSCRVGAIRAQIERTLMQFSSVRRVEIFVPGKTAEETLQP
jgi:hypothetical protein